MKSGLAFCMMVGTFLSPFVGAMMGKRPPDVQFILLWHIPIFFICLAVIVYDVVTALTRAVREIDDDDDWDEEVEPTEPPQIPNLRIAPVLPRTPTEVSSN